MQYCFCYKSIYNEDIIQGIFICNDNKGQIFYWVNVDKFLGIANKEKRKYGLNNDYCAMISILRKIDDKLYVVVPFIKSDDKVWKKDGGIVPEYYSVIDPKETKILEFNKTTEENFVIKDIKRNNSDGSFEKEISKYIVDTKLKYKNYIKDDIKNNELLSYQNKVSNILSSAE